MRGRGCGLPWYSKTEGPERRFSGFSTTTLRTCTLEKTFLACDSCLNPHVSSKAVFITVIGLRLYRHPWYIPWIYCEDLKKSINLGLLNSLGGTGWWFWV